MAKINTLNYQTVASWNGSQDLFVVEQPDGTKVATPEQIKQYVLDGVTETSEQYAECSTARNVAAKTVTLPGFKLEAGARISVRFTGTDSSNPASGNITLNVNGTGAKEIVDSHTNKTKLTYTSGGLFYNNLVDDFVYDGTYWVYMNRDNNTTYTSKAAASGGTATSLCTTGEKYTWNNKQNALTFDNAPNQNSSNPVKSGGVKTYVDNAVATATTWTDISSRCTVDTTKVASFSAYTCGKIIYISLTLKAGVTDQSNVVTNLPQVIRYGVLPMFYMNVIDITSGGVCMYAGTTIQYRGNATQGSGGTQYSGMFLLV